MRVFFSGLYRYAEDTWHMDGANEPSTSRNVYPAWHWMPGLTAGPGSRAESGATVLVMRVEKLRTLGTLLRI